MNKKFTLLSASLSLICLASCGGGSSVVSSVVSSAASSESTSSTSESSSHTLFVVGDSTVCDFPTETTYYRRYGYGTQLVNYFNTENLTINNLALSGRSSSSFTSEDNYTTLTSSIKKGDFLLIGFGHNDEKSGDVRYTDPTGDYKTEGSFQHSLYTNYVKVALDIGAYPILCTPICRYSSSSDYTGSCGHVTSDGDYPAAIKTLGTTFNVPVIDLTTETKNLYTSLSEDDAKHLFAYSTPTAMYDTTHTSIWGASYNAYFIAKDLQSTSSTLKDYVKSGITAPTRADTLVVNPNYVEVTTSDDFTPSEIYTTVTAPWYGTAFGDLGGTPSADNKAAIGDVVETDEANIEVRAGSPATNGSKGKIASGGDGFVMAFQQKDIDNDYTFTAKAKLVAINSTTNQIAFGMQARTSILIDTKVSGVIDDYAAAGIVYSSTASNAPFGRVSGALTKGDAVTNLPAVNDVIDLSIQKKNTQADGTADYVCKFGDYTSTYTITPASGKTKVYFSLFATRSVDVAFSDISLVNNN